MSAILASTWWAWLLGVNPGSGSWSFGWAHSLAGWAWVGIILAAAGFAAFSYKGLIGARAGRIILASVRTVILLLVIVLLAGPMLVDLSRHVQHDTLLVLVDRSASMQVKDTLGPAGRAQSRAHALAAALMKQKAVFSDAALGHNRKIQWLGFGGGAFPISTPWSKHGMGPARRDATKIRTAIDQALGRAGGAPIAGIVLFTDGQTPQSTGEGLVHRLARAGASVFSVPVGAKHLPIDLTLASVQAPARSFKNDFVPITATVERVGGGHVPDPGDVKVQLLSAKGKMLDHTTLAGVGLGQPVHLSATARHVGDTHWRVKVVYRPPGRQRELNTGNNTQPVHVDIVDRPLRVLYVEGYPRWQYRYLTNMLVREKSIAASILLLSSDSAYAQEGNIPIRRFPDTAAELRPYDVIILGDISAGALSSQQLRLIRKHVSRDGAGLLWIGGSRYMPTDWAGSALANLLPMTDPAGVSSLSLGSNGINLWPTAVARRLNVLDLRGPDTKPGQTWPPDLPALQWAQRLGPIKPAAEILARAGHARGQAGHGTPLVVRMRYGAGSSVYVGTDGTWRWRYARGDIYFQQFWIQLVRMLGRGRLAAGAGRAQLTVSRSRITRGHTVVVKLSTNDPVIISRQMSRVHLSIKRGGAGGHVVDSLTLRPVSGTGRGRAVFQAQWQPSATGHLLLSVDEPGLADLHIEHRVQVLSSTNEREHPQTDFARLAKLSKATGGAVVSLDNLKRLKKLVPNRARIDEHRTDHPIWDSPLALALVVLLLTGEWIGRKAIRLV